MTRHYSSNAEATTLAADITDATTSFPVAATTGFPATDFILAIDYGTATQELVLVTAVAGLQLTVTRGYDSTTPQAHTTGAAVRHVHAGIDFRDSRTHEAAATGVHGITGDVVGTTDTQSLSNKNLSTGNTFPASLATLSGTQALTNKDLSDATNVFPASLATDAEVSTAVSNHAALTATHGVTGAIVGTTDTQTLTNKTLTDPVITGGGLTAKPPLICTSATRPGHAEGQVIEETDTNLVLMSDGTDWNVIADMGTLPEVTLGGTDTAKTVANNATDATIHTTTMTLALGSQRRRIEYFFNFNWDTTANAAGTVKMKANGTVIGSIYLHNDNDNPTVSRWCSIGGTSTATFTGNVTLTIEANVSSGGASITFQRVSGQGRGVRC